MKLNNSIICLLSIIALVVGMIVCLTLPIIKQIKILAAVLICISICSLSIFNIIRINNMFKKNKK